MRKLRKQAFGLRRDALAGLSAAERERFVDALLAIKANLSRLQRGGEGWNAPMKRVLLLVVVPAVAVAAGLMIWLQGGRFEETENAYVKAHIIAVSADLSGRVVEVAVRDNEAVAAGALLFRIDPAPFEAHGGACRGRDGGGAHRCRGPARRARPLRSPTPRKPRSASAFSLAQLERQAKLKERGMGLEASFDKARHNLEAARRRLESAREKAVRVLTALGGDAELPARRLTRASSPLAPPATPGATSSRVCASWRPPRAS